VSNRTRSKAEYTEHHIGSRTRSEIHNENVNNLSVHDLFFHLHDVTLFQGHGKSKAQDLQSGVLDYKVHHNVLLSTTSYVDFDHLTQINSIDRTKEYKGISWECHKVVDYCKEKGDVDSSNKKCLVEWKEINKTTIPCTLFKIIQIGWNSTQMLEKKFQRIFLLKKGQESG
jgi:hypothetical protein